MALTMRVSPAPWRIPVSGLVRVVDGPARVALVPLAWVLAVTGAAFRRPSAVVAVAVLLVCLPSNLQALGTSLTVADVAIAGAVMLGAVRLIAGDRVMNPRGLLPFAAVVVSVATAAVTASEITPGLQSFAHFLELFVLVPVVVAMALRDGLDVLLVAGSVIVTSLIEGSVGAYQSLTRTGASYAGQFIRAVGTFGANQVLALGALLGYGIVVTLALGLAFRGWTRIVLLATAAVLVLPLAASLSRGAWIATVVAVLVTLAAFSWRLALWMVGLSALAILVMASGFGGASTGSLDERLTSILAAGSAPDRSVQDRYALWTTAVDIWVDHPITGVGLKGFAEHRDSYAPMALSAGSDVNDRTSGFRREPLLSPHNQYLLVLSEQGTVGIAAFGTLLGTLTVAALLRGRPGQPAGRLPAGRGATASASGGPEGGYPEGGQSEGGPDGAASDGAASDRAASDRATKGDGLVGAARGGALAGGAAGRASASVGGRFLVLVAAGIIVWTLIDFLYGDIGAGPSGVVLAVLLGVVARRRIIVPRPAASVAGAIS
jgi:O-antigen ligase